MKPKFFFITVMSVFMVQLINADLGINVYNRLQGNQRIAVSIQTSQSVEDTTRPCYPGNQADFEFYAKKVGMPNQGNIELHYLVDGNWISPGYVLNFPAALNAYNNQVVSLIVINAFGRVVVRTQDGREFKLQATRNSEDV